MSGPPETPTRQLPKDEITQGLLRNLANTVTEGFQKLERRIDALERGQEQLEERARQSSMRVRGVSEVDRAHEKKIADEIMAREALARQLEATKQQLDATKEQVATIEQKTDAQTAILQRLDKIASNPVVKAVATAAGTAVLTWLSMKGLR